jgi:radical SAM-linked protein
MAVSKFRFRFRKAGDLRFLSHHDLMRVFERMLRRAELPFRSTEGFHPKPKMAFASALALGIVGQQEVIEIEFEGDLSAEQILCRLAAQAPAGLELMTARPIEPKVKAQVCRATYQVDLEPWQLAGIAHRLDALMLEPHCWVERLKPQPRRINIRPFLHRLAVQGCSLVMEFLVTPQGSARAEDILRLLDLNPESLQGAVLERTTLVLADETPSAPVAKESGARWSDESAVETGQEEPALPTADA